MEEKQLEPFRKALMEEEKSPRTLEKYIRDLRKFFRYAQRKRGTQAAVRVDKELVIGYKAELMKDYAVASVNSMLAALNRFFKHQGWFDCLVRLLRIQRDACRREEREISREEYFHLVKAAEAKGKKRLSLLMQTLCSTGIRISELPFITVEAVRKGSAMVCLKGKIRKVILPEKLCTYLLAYALGRGIVRGSIFITRSGRTMDRSNVLHEMKGLAEAAGVDCCRIFPHNLRHLFACTYYETEKDLSHLADILGHSSVNTTRIYTMRSGREQAEQIGSLDLLWDEKKAA